MNLPGQTTVRSSGVKAQQPAVVTRARHGGGAWSWYPRTATAGCHAFTPELRSVAWPGKLKPYLPPRYDSTPDPAEFLQLYELSIEAANGDERVMANWFPMALKDGARPWLLNLPARSMPSWGEMRDRFIANFQGLATVLRPR